MTNTQMFFCSEKNLSSASCDLHLFPPTQIYSRNGFFHLCSEYSFTSIGIVASIYFWERAQN